METFVPHWFRQKSLEIDDDYNFPGHFGIYKTMSRLDDYLCRHKGIYVKRYLEESIIC